MSVLLVNFRFNNFLSYNELSHFSMVSGKSRRHKEHIFKYNDVSLLKFAALYGANAAGKSNLVTAIDFSKRLLLKGFPQTISRDLHCKINEQNKYEQTQFEYEIIIDNVVYAYGYTVNLFEKNVQQEWLYSLEKNEETMIFVRDKGNEKEVMFNYDILQLNDSDTSRLNFYTLDLINKATDSLLITELNNNKQDFYSANKRLILNELYDWFQNTLEVVSPDRPTEGADVSYFKKKKQLVLANFLDAFGTGIKEVKTKQINKKELYNEMPKALVNRILDDISAQDGNGAMFRTHKNIYEIERKDGELIINTLLFKHEVDDVYYSLGEESDGTVRLVEIYSILVSDSDKVYVVDELDRSLHPNLTYHYVKEFLDKENNSQLIVTTHEDRLLDLNMLRRDEIWFVEKEEDGASRLYSLEAFKERFDKDVLKAYLEGRYGSVPAIQLLKL